MIVRIVPGLETTQKSKRHGSLYIYFMPSLNIILAIATLLLYVPSSSSLLTPLFLHTYNKPISKNYFSVSTAAPSFMTSGNKDVSTLLLGSEIPKDLKLILASKSPRRAEILDMMGLRNKYQIIPSPLDEDAAQIELQAMKVKPSKYVKMLAERKALALVNNLSSLSSENSEFHSTIIIGSDTIVDLDDNILEKPIDERQAFEMLTKLSNKWHAVHTGVSIVSIDAKGIVQSVTFSETSRVKFFDLSSKDIQAYINTGDPMDKAGSYGIQGIGGQLVERIEGDFYTIMGLPMHRVSKELSGLVALLSE